MAPQRFVLGGWGLTRRSGNPTAQGKLGTVTRTVPTPRDEGLCCVTNAKAHLPSKAMKNIILGQYFVIVVTIAKSLIFLCLWFGTRRPEVRILSPRPFHLIRFLTADG